MAYLLASKTLDNIKPQGYSISAYKIKFEVWLNSQSIPNNTSNITIKSFIATKGATWGWYGWSGIRLVTSVDGVGTTTNNEIKDLPQNSTDIWRQHGEWRGNIQHGSAGDKKINVYQSLSGGSAPYLPVASSQSLLSIVLPTIPRASICSFSSHQMGDKFRVTTNRKSTSFTHNLTVYVNNVQILTRSGVGDYVDITPTENQKIAMHNASPNSYEAIMKIKCETFNGSTKIGESTTEEYVLIDFNVSMPEFIGCNTREMNNTIRNLLSTFEKLVYGYSILKVTIPTDKKAVAKMGASILKYEITIGNQQRSVNYSDDEINETFDIINGSTLTVNAVDSRGLEATYIKQFNFIDNYVPPIFTKVELVRENGIGTSVYMNATFKLSYQHWEGNYINTLIKFRYRTRPKNGTWTEWFDKSNEIRAVMTNNQSTITVNDFLLHRLGSSGTFDLGQEYDVEIEITDGNYILEDYKTPFNTISKVFNVTDGTVLEAFYKENGEHFRGYGGMPNENFNHTFYGSVGVNGKSLLDFFYPIGTLYETTSSDLNTVAKMNAYFGGTWEEFAKGRTLVGVDTSQTEFNSVEKIGGEKKHTLTVSEMPEHQHKLTLLNYGTNTASGVEWNSTHTTKKYAYASDMIEPVGGNQPHNNLQPYITVYIWKRVA